jgi:tetratricopeptide (TPR) repeat protein
VVQFLVDTYGFDRLRATLAALGEGADINAALAQHFAPLEELDAAFARFARAKADEVAGPFDLRPPDERLGNALALLDRKNLYGQLRQARELEQAGRGLEARFILKGLTADGFYLPGRENVHQRLAEVCRDLGDTAGERDALIVIAEHESDALEAVARLLEIAEAAGDPAAAARWADQWLTINPLAPTPWRALFTAREKTGDTPAAIAAGNKLLRLDPPDRAAIHFRLAQLWLKSDPEQARHHVLLALEEAPRFRHAHALLDELPPAPDVAAALTSP